MVQRVVRPRQTNGAGWRPRRLSMRQIREILRQKWALGLSHRAVASSLRVGLGTISSVVSRAQAAGLNLGQVQTLADEALEDRLYGRLDVAGQRQRPHPTAPGSATGRSSPAPGTAGNGRPAGKPRQLSAPAKMDRLLHELRTQHKRGGVSWRGSPHRCSLQDPTSQGLRLQTGVSP
jgi:hypothetical protein